FYFVGGDSSGGFVAMGVFFSKNLPDRGDRLRKSNEAGVKCSLCMASNLSSGSPNEFIGAGLSFPIGTNVQGSFQLSNGTTNLEESIRIILGTRLGERAYRPNFGSRLSEIMFEPMNTQVLMLIRLYVREAIEMWEPRLTLKDVITEPDPSTGRVSINIVYQPRNSYDIRSLVYPFFLMQSGDGSQ
ncbi:MAG: GPW/gp25 family protein, partial [Cyanobacteria bacterium J06598_1]